MHNSEQLKNEFQEWLLKKEEAKNRPYEILNNIPQSQKITQNTDIPHDINTWKSAVDCVLPNLHIFPYLNLYDRSEPYMVAAYVLEPSSIQKQVLSCVDSKSKKEVTVDLSPFERYSVTDERYSVTDDMTIVLVAIEYGDRKLQVLRDIKAVGKDGQNAYRLTVGSSVYEKDYIYNTSDYDDMIYDPDGRFGIFKGIMTYKRGE